MSVRVYCDFGARICSADFYNGGRRDDHLNHGWVRTRDGRDLCPGHAPKPKAQSE